MVVISHTDTHTHTHVVGVFLFCLFFGRGSRQNNSKKALTTGIKYQYTFTLFMTPCQGSGGFTKIIKVRKRYLFGFLGCVSLYDMIPNFCNI